MKEDLNETRWDKLLMVHTLGRDDSNSDQNNYPYEPTPYSVLERLANSGYIGKKNTLLDYGCGKGRVDFFISYQTGCKTIGVEYDEQIYEKAMQNKKNGAFSQKSSFVLENAEKFEVPQEVDRIFFFNPFSTKILQSVISRIMDSFYKNMRNIQLFFYYPQDEYISFLMSVDELMFLDEIDCKDLFPGNNQRERIAIFEIG